MTIGTAPGRRERNKAEKQRRIGSAAAELFARQGYARTTTQQVATAADVAEGTVFRYAVSKPELLLMVLNEQMRPLLAAGRQRAASAASVAEAILDVLAPFVELADSQPENAGPFLREVLFGDDGPHRQESIALVDEAVAEIAELMRPHLQVPPEGLDFIGAARWVFSALVTEVVSSVVGRGSPDRRTVLRARVAVLLRGLGVA